MVTRETPARLRAVVVIFESTLTHDPTPMLERLVDDPGMGSGTGGGLQDTTFPGWARRLGCREERLRRSIAGSDPAGWLDPRPEELGFVRTLVEIGTVRSGLLAAGPSEFVEPWLEHHALAGSFEGVYHHDRYPHGSRRTLLKLLQNHFVANGERTLVLGGTASDETLAQREGCRFCSFRSPPDTADHPDRWGWTPERLVHYLREHRPPAPSG